MTRHLLATACTTLGAALLAAGVAVIYWPAGLIVAGALLLAAGLFGIDVG
jgi:multisubunit Na+/H+ antiporter MnhG subunit